MKLPKLMKMLLLLFLRNQRKPPLFINGGTPIKSYIPNLRMEIQSGLINIVLNILIVDISLFGLKKLAILLTAEY